MGIFAAYLKYGIVSQPAEEKDTQAEATVETNEVEKTAATKAVAAKPATPKAAARKERQVVADEATLDFVGESAQDQDHVDPLAAGCWKLPRFALENDKDEYYTPDNATAMLLPYLPKGKTIWECAWGLGHMARCLQSHGHTVVGDPNLDFLTEYIEAELSVTNPPFSKKDAFLERAYSLGKPFAMLLPADSLVGLERYPLFSKHGIQLLIPNRRFQFICDKNSSANFNTFWCCWKLLPRDIVFAELPLDRPTAGGKGVKQ